MVETKATNIVWHDGDITVADRRQQFGHHSFIIWFTGLSGSGKSTLAVALEQYLFTQRKQAYRLDGDNIRHGLNKDLGFSAADRTENIRRIGEVSKLFVDAGVIVLTAFISPYRSDRDSVRALVQPNEFVEVYVQCSLDQCEQRDTKGLYAKARAGQIPEFTGISAPYEEPLHPEIIVNTEQLNLQQSLEYIVVELKRLQYL